MWCVSRGNEHFENDMGNAATALQLHQKQRQKKGAERGLNYADNSRRTVACQMDKWTETEHWPKEEEIKWTTALWMAMSWWTNEKLSCQWGWQTKDKRLSKRAELVIVWPNDRLLLLPAYRLQGKLTETVWSRWKTSSQIAVCCCAKHKSINRPLDGQKRWQLFFEATTWWWPLQCEELEQAETGADREEPEDRMSPGNGEQRA